MTECQNRIDADDPESPQCGDEGRSCDSCSEREAKYWADYFGLRPGMSREESRAQLERMRPHSDSELREMQIEALKLK